MKSVIRFFRAPDKNENKEYKTATLRDAENTEFKFYELSRTDVMRKGELKIHIDTASKVICTSFEYNFNNDDVIIIDGIDYRIKSIYIEKDEDDNNFFGIKCRQRSYITLGTDY